MTDVAGKSTLISTAITDLTLPSYEESKEQNIFWLYKSAL